MFNDYCGGQCLGQDAARRQHHDRNQSSGCERREVGVQSQSQERVSHYLVDSCSRRRAIFTSDSNLNVVITPNRRTLQPSTTTQRVLTVLANCLFCCENNVAMRVNP